MIKLKRKLDQKVQEVVIYTKAECDEMGIAYIYWKDADVGDMALSDDDYVGLMLQKKTYGPKKIFIKTVYGVQWVRDSLQLLFEPNYEAGIYSLIKPRHWAEREAKTTRLRNTVDAYVTQMVSPYKVDWNLLGNIYRPDQKRPDQTVKRLFKQKVVKDMVEAKLKAVLSDKGITKSFVLDKMKKAIEIAENKEDVNGLLKASDAFMDLLEMKPNKKVTTDTFQIDVTNQIADQIEKEDKKMLMSRKTEEQEPVE